MKQPPHYIIDFGFDAEGEPPKVFIRDTYVWPSPQVIEILEEPTCGIVEGWSWSGWDWQAGPLALRVLALLNGNDSGQ